MSTERNLLYALSILRMKVILMHSKYAMVPELFSALSSSAKITYFTKIDEIPLEFWFMYPYSCSIDDGEQYCWVDKSGLVS